jgi:leucyl aminopeptidase (aminopeptidase T)
VEKVGGTLHIAIGQSYDECYPTEGVEGGIEALVTAGICNRSAQHVDIVVDFRPGGCGRRVYFDDREVVVRGGLWAPLD